MFSVLILGSCEEVKDIVPLPSMKATVNGEAWTSIFRATVLFEHNNMITISGTPEASQDVDKAIIISIFGTEAGTYTLNPGTLTTECGIVYKKTADAAHGGDNYYTSYSTTVTMTEIDKDKKRISGTFSGSLLSTGVEEITISNGTFENLNYTVEQ